MNDIPPISLVIMGALGSLFFTGKEFIMIELTVSLSWILLGCLWVVHIPFRNFVYEGICLMASVKGMVIITFLKASNRLSSVSLFLAFGLLRA